MSFLIHSAIFLGAIVVIWYFAGLLVNAVVRVSHRLHKSGFAMAFILLGFLTSIGEMSVAINALTNDVPQVAVGNLIGASFLLTTLIIPLLAILGNGIALNKIFTPRILILTIGLIVLPALFVIDGVVSLEEGIVTLILYCLLIFFVHRKSSTHKHPRVAAVVEGVQSNLISNSKRTIADMLKICIGAVVIFLAGYLLVREVLFFSDYFNVPSSLVGLLILSLGTNIPELMIAVRTLLHGHKDVAFGDYLGSALTNAPIFAFLGIIRPGFAVDTTGFQSTLVLFIPAAILLFIFCQTKHRITRAEGITLLSIYGIFLLLNIGYFLV